MRMLVTGGAGFIGSNFIRYVLRETDDVRITNLDALTYAGDLASLRDVEEDARYRFVHGDVCNQQVVDELVSNADAVVHFAAESHVDRSIDGPAEFLRTNVLGAGVVFEAARRHEVERVLHLSTDEVYGSIAEADSFVETDALEPNSPYSASKAAADLLARSYHVTYGFPIMVTRTANNLVASRGWCNSDTGRGSCWGPWGTCATSPLGSGSGRSFLLGVRPRSRRIICSSRTSAGV